jgi:hypothetical protein
VKRTLTLRRETLAELAADDLRAVHGASGVACYTGVTWCIDACYWLTRDVDRVTSAINVTPQCPA